MAGKYDLIVIGAGNGGLSAAACGAKNGLKVLVLEKQNSPGGAASSFVRGRFEFEPSLHELCTVGTAENKGGMWKLFESLDADVEWCTGMDETYRMLVPEEGIDVTMPCGVQNFIAKLEEEVPGSAPSMTRMIQLGAEIARAWEEPNKFEPGNEEFVKAYPNFVKLAGYSVSEVLDALEMPEKAKAIVSNYWCYLGASADTLDFLSYARMLLGYIVYGAGMAKGFSHGISTALEKVICENGGEILYNTEAQRIIIEDGKAAGVVANGEEIRADYIVSNAYPQIVFGKMVNSDEVPETAKKTAAAGSLGLSFGTVYLGMNKTPAELGISAYSTFISHTSDSAAVQTAATDTTGYPGYVIVNCLNKLIPSATPEGTCQLFLTTPFFGRGWDNVSAEEYGALKLKLATAMIEDAEKSMGISIKPFIEEIEIATPVTLARFLGTPCGTPYGYQVSPTCTGVGRQYLEQNGEETIPGLLFVGASTRRGDGYSSAYLSGMDAIKKIMANRAGKENC